MSNAEPLPRRWLDGSPGVPSARAGQDVPGHQDSKTPWHGPPPCFLNTHMMCMSGEEWPAVRAPRQARGPTLVPSHGSPFLRLKFFAISFRFLFLGGGGDFEELVEFDFPFPGSGRGASGLWSLTSESPEDLPARALGAWGALGALGALRTWAQSRGEAGEAGHGELIASQQAVPFSDFWDALRSFFPPPPARALAEDVRLPLAQRAAGQKAKERAD